MASDSEQVSGESVPGRLGQPSRRAVSRMKSSPSCGWQVTSSLKLPVACTTQHTVHFIAGEALR